MNDLLEGLKFRFAEAKRKLDETNRALEVAKADHDRAVRVWSAWASALDAETGIPVTEWIKQSLSSGSPEQAAVAIKATDAIPAVPSEAAEPSADGMNKTELIRDVLRRHPTGMKPSALWSIVQDQIPNRSYVHSVLGRLKEKQEVVNRRGKYYFRAAVTKEEQEQQAAQPVVQ